jgi:RNA polymerase sigma-70 factor, ECF subfamily
MAARPLGQCLLLAHLAGLAGRLVASWLQLLIVICRCQDRDCSTNGRFRDTSRSRNRRAGRHRGAVSDVEDEIELMRRTAKGDAAAFRTLSDVHLGKIMSFAYRLLHDRTEAEDVAQETFLRLWKDAARYEPRARVGTWLHRIAHNLCIDRLRKRRERPTENMDEERVSQEPGGLLDRKRVAGAVERALAALPERQRAAIALVHYQGLSNIEAAEVLGVGVEAVESLLARGRRSLREMLLDLRPEGGPT